MAAGERLLIQGRDNELLLAELQLGGLKIVDRMPVDPQPVGESTVPCSYPAVVGGRLYVRTADAVICLRLD